MPVSVKDRKRKQRDKYREMGMAVMSLSLSAVERSMIQGGATADGYEDQTEYLLDLVRKNRDESQKITETCPDCRGRGCFTCCNSEAEIRMRDSAGATA